VLRFQVEGNIQTFNVNDVVALTFTHSSGNAAPPPPSDPAPRLLPLRLPGLRPHQLRKRGPFPLAARSLFPPDRVFWSA